MCRRPSRLDGTDGRRGCEQARHREAQRPVVLDRRSGQLRLLRQPPERRPDDPGIAPEPHDGADRGPVEGPQATRQPPRPASRHLGRPDHAYAADGGPSRRVPEQEEQPGAEGHRDALHQGAPCCPRHGDECRKSLAPAQAVPRHRRCQPPVLPAAAPRCSRLRQRTAGRRCEEWSRHHRARPARRQCHRRSGRAPDLRVGCALSGPAQREGQGHLGRPIGREGSRQDDHVPRWRPCGAGLVPDRQRPAARLADLGDGTRHRHVHVRRRRPQRRGALPPQPRQRCEPKGAGEGPGVDQLPRRCSRWRATERQLRRAWLVVRPWSAKRQAGRSQRARLHRPQRQRRSGCRRTGPVQPGSQLPVPVHPVPLDVNALHHGAPVLVGSGHGQLLEDQPSAERHPGLLLREQLPRPPGGCPDRLHQWSGQLRDRSTRCWPSRSTAPTATSMAMARSTACRTATTSTTPT